MTQTKDKFVQKFTFDQLDGKLINQTKDKFLQKLNYNQSHLIDLSTSTKEKVDYR